METSDPVTKLCEVCSKLDTQRLAHPLHPCPNQLSCSEPQIERGHVGGYLALGSVDEIKNRRSNCDICRLIAECLDKEPSDLTGECRITETGRFGSFKLPSNVKPSDLSTMHFHLTEAFVIFDTSEADQYQGPSLPWDLKARYARSTHIILSLQVSNNSVLIGLTLISQSKTKARSCPEPRNPTSVPLQTEQEFLATIGGRYVGTQVNVQLIREWLHECERKHGNVCMPAMHLLAERYKEPALVVDVIESCLVDTPSQCRYVALSYVWGRAAVFKHLLKNSQDLRKTGSLRSLPIPATIRDAMTLVHAIGERYLWVDSLCIIQDDLRMQQTEITRMGSIYSGALFTIIAAAGEHANSGLPGIGPGTREQVQKVLKLANCELLTVINIRTQNGINDTIWSQRAWTFQERAVSNRVLVFSENQVYWNCRAASHSEERALEAVQDLEPLDLPFPQKPINDFLPWKFLQPLEYCDLYDDLLYNYRQRRLTYQTDILNAFNGVTEMLVALQNDTFFWGLPESVFSYAMIWELTGHSSPNHIEVPIFGCNGSKEMIPIPSWSWAAWSGQDDALHLRSLLDFANNPVRPLIQFSIVDTKHELVMIKEKLWGDQPGDRVYTLRRNASPSHQLPSPSQHELPTLQVGHLRFWTSIATLTVARRWNLGARGIDYLLFPPSNYEPNPNGARDRSEIINQEFIVVASRGAALILLAIEWKDRVAYRVGKAEVTATAWDEVEDRRWRLITLG